MAGSLIGRIDPFDRTEEDWPTYIERLDQYFAANAITDDRKVPAFISLIGPKTYGLLKNLIAPEKPSTKSYTELVDVLRKHLAPKPLVIAERFRFHKRDQREGESVTAYLAELRRLTEYCEFGSYLNDALRDRLVCGLRAGNITKRLLAEAKLTFKKAIEIATAMEAAAKDAVEFQQQLKPETSVHKFAAKPQPTSTSTCYRCGKSGHSPNQCHFKDATCHGCNKKGHIRPVCRSSASPQQASRPRNSRKGRPQGGKAKAKPMKSVEEASSDDDMTYVGRLGVNNLDHRKDSTIWLTPSINGTNIRMELDTGSAVSVISKADYQRHFANSKLESTPVKLQTYTGEKVSPVGCLQVDICYQEQRHTGLLYVVQRGGPALFGRDWLAHFKLDWPSIFAISSEHPPVNMEAKLQALLDSYPELFKDEIGERTDIRAKLTLKDNAHPVFLKARQVPYALRPQVEAEHAKLQQQNIISPVETSEWATPIVPVPKKNGGVRICGDFKVTVNANLHVDHYPLPKIDDVFATLAGGQHFSKLDLKQAYLHMVMDEESSKLLTLNTHKGLFKMNRLAFGVASAPAIWQRTMEQIIQGIPGVQCILDDMLITGRDNTEHLRNLEKVLSVLRDRGLRLNISKCEFFKSKLLEKNHKWAWSTECETAFEQAKTLITSEEVLTHYDPKLPVKLACDASPYGLGSVMSHVMPDNTERPIAYASRTLSSAERNYSQIDKEALALVWGVKKFNNYLCGRKFTLVTITNRSRQYFIPLRASLQ
ncbi:uncharacterized protein K02A2.6-like [Patiria miniata]|uniref:Reverse transcriptase n=1 Tax=Patiria miniata TaxID=46514 RepID=A0A914B2S7_PATMI|nr:uncharacterized protein K02A2.6-like [Patiria miniata]